jgi:hypothetical protein
MTNWKGSSGGGTRDSGPKSSAPRLLAALVAFDVVLDVVKIPAFARLQIS